MELLEVIKTLILGIVEGITEWLPISSTGHLILADEFLQSDKSSVFSNANFMEMFMVVIQLAAILAVILIFWNKIFPFGYDKKKKNVVMKEDIFVLWFKILVGSVPAGIIGLLFDDWIDSKFYNFQTVSIMLILYGILFIVVENWNKNKTPKVNDLKEITYKTAFIIGIFQMLALIPGTSRSGATIVGALLIGVSRVAAAEFTFYLAIPAMFGASLLKLLKFGFDFTSGELLTLLIGMVTSFVVSVWAIKFLMQYIKKHDFKVFGYYRIILGILLIVYMFTMM